MKLINSHNRAALKTDLLLLAGSFIVYFIYMHVVFLNLNSVLSSAVEDSLKNYYTFAWHVKHDASWLNFSGMNYPFGEHSVYTDCQPALCLLLRCLPFTHNYLVGILHGLILLSFIVTPVIFNKIFRRLSLPALPSALISLGITFLSPQLFRIYEGHYALAYACIIPLCLLLLLRLFETPTFRRSAELLLYNTFIFFIHPYLAFGLCVFCCLSLLVFMLADFKRQRTLPFLTRLAVVSFLPVIVFKVFMLLTDTHVNRPVEPYGLDTSVTSAGSLLTPTIGPFKELLQHFFHTSPGDFEGYCYLGAVLIALVLLFAVALIVPRTYKILKVQKEAFSFFIAALLLLLFAFGLHNHILKLLHTESPALNQFRAAGRFSWFFYYVLPVFLFCCMYKSLSQVLSAKVLRNGFIALALLFFVSNLWEAAAVMNQYNKYYFKDRNIFNAEFLNSHERHVLESLQQRHPQALLPLPTYHIGNEVYGRLSGSDLSCPLIPSILYSYHAGLPIISGMMSRTSISETEEGVNLLNAYKKEHPALTLMNEHDLFIIKSKAALMPDEERLWRKTKPFYTNDSLQFGYLKKQDLIKPVYDKTIAFIASGKDYADSAGIVHVPQRNAAPYINYSDIEYAPLFTLDSNKVEDGNYIASLHFYSNDHSWKDVLCHLLVTENKDGKSVWHSFLPISVMSGFYKGFAVFECQLKLEKKNSYGFFIRRDGPYSFKVSDFMLRPAGTTVGLINAKDTAYNNFPKH